MPQCPNCGANVARQATNCAYCGTSNPQHEVMAVSLEAILAGAKALVELDNYAPAVELFRLALSQAPDLFDPYFALAHCLSQLNRYTEAVQAMQAALRVFPGHAIALYNAGIMLKASGRSQEARAYFEQSWQELDRHPKRYPNPVHVRAGLRKELGS